MRRIALCLWAICALTGSAGAAQITVELSGSSYNGPPAFLVFADGVVVGEGTLDPEAALKAFSFEVNLPELVPGTVLGVALTNDLFEGKGKDRNLFVHGISVDGQYFGPSDLVVRRDGIPVRSNPETAAPLYSAGEVAVLTMPSPEAAEEGVTNSPDEPKDTERSSVALEAAPAEALEKKSCGLSATVSGFGNNAASLSDAQVSLLVAMKEELSHPECELVVTGYSSSAGDAATNQRVSKARAEAVAGYIENAGMVFRLVTVTGAGGTVGFGPRAADNRVVVVELR